MPALKINPYHIITLLSCRVYVDIFLKKYYMQIILLKKIFASTNNVTFFCKLYY